MYEVKLEEVNHTMVSPDHIIQDTTFIPDYPIGGKCLLHAMLA